MIAEKVESVFDAQAYEAPFLTEKLLKEHIVETPEEALALFGEVKRYLILSFTDETTSWELYSRRVDEVWHQFVLFTREYVDFSMRYFGRYIHHYPGNAPGAAPSSSVQGTFVDFQKRYEEVFGVELPDVWYDEDCITPHRRIINQNVGRLTLRTQAGKVDLLNGSGNVLLSVNDLAQEALAFTAQTGAFYVRELPGDLTNEEKVALIATLVKFNLLRVGS